MLSVGVRILQIDSAGAPEALAGRLPVETVLVGCRAVMVSDQTDQILTNAMLVHYSG